MIFNLFDEANATEFEVCQRVPSGLIRDRLLQLDDTVAQREAEIEANYTDILALKRGNAEAERVYRAAAQRVATLTSRINEMAHLPSPSMTRIEELERALSIAEVDADAAMATLYATQQRAQTVAYNEPEFARRMKAFVADKERLVDWAIRSVVRISVSGRELTPHQYELCKSDADGEFWMQQSMPVLEAAAAVFQKAAGLGRLCYREHTPVASNDIAATSEQYSGPTATDGEAAVDVAAVAGG